MAEDLPVAEMSRGFVEYRTTFMEPIFAAWYSKEALAVASVYKALVPWGVDLENVSWNANAKNLKEAQVTFTITTLPVVLHIGIGGLTIIISNADWSQAPALIALSQAVLDTLRGLGVKEIYSQEAVLGFHISPGPKPFREIMKQFVNTKALGLDDSQMYGVGSYGADFSLVIDNSIHVPQGVFVRITRVFPAATRFDEIASILSKDEESWLHRLGFRAQ